jgi:hypothetical protein
VRRIPGLPVHWQQYLCCIAMHLLLPFLPILLEKVLTGAIDDKSVILFVAMYAMSIGITSNSVLAFSLTLTVGVIYCAGYGAAVTSNLVATPLKDVAWWVLSAVGILHAFERFNRHIADREPFFEFSRAPRGGGE